MNKSWIMAAAAAGVAASVAASAGASIPATLGVQGALSNGGGAVADGAYTVTFSLYASASAPAPLWSEPASATVADGVFNHALGTVVPLPTTLGTAAELWLGVRVEGEPELPRTQLQSVAYALFAGHAASADVAASAQALACTACVGPAALSFDPVTEAELQAALAGLPKLDAIDGLVGGTLLSGLDLSGHELTTWRVQNATAAPYACSATAAGAMYFDTVRKLFFGCDGTRWIALSKLADGASADNPGRTCKTLLEGGATQSGPYWIDPDGGPTSDAFQAYCDMASAGGGWTLVAYNFDKNRTFLTGTYHAVTGPLIPQPGTEAAILPASVGLEYTQIAFSLNDPQWTSATRSYSGFWVGESASSTYDLTSNVCQLLSPTSPSQWSGQLVYFAGNGNNDDGCNGGGSVFTTGHTCDDGGGGVTTNTAWPQNGSDTLWGHNCISSYSPTGAYKLGAIPNQGLHAYWVR